ncbi:MAG: hypothetical protein KatS3mg089_0999 [Patescibacteria group bacterium]|nr:MAG: hypothetical protein KatS3mg089_0999 [Patescibacteria group bacterium]
MLQTCYLTPMSEVLNPAGSEKQINTTLLNKDKSDPKQTQKENIVFAKEMVKPDFSSNESLQIPSTINDGGYNTDKAKRIDYGYPIHLDQPIHFGDVFEDTDYYDKFQT